MRALLIVAAVLAYLAIGVLVIGLLMRALGQGPEDGDGVGVASCVVMWPLMIVVAVVLGTIVLLFRLVQHISGGWS